MSSSDHCISANNVFGPVIDSACNYGGFDFTLFFEETILTIIPSAIAVLWTTLRIFELWKTQTCVQQGSLLYYKLVAYLVLLGLQITLWTVWSLSQTPKTTATIPALALSTMIILPLTFVSYLEHARSVKPSTMLILYFGLSALFDAVRIRTVFSVAHTTPVVALLLSSFCSKVLIFVLENYEKRALIVSEKKCLPLESTAGVINRSFFLWLNSLLALGYRTWLTLDLLMPIDSEILSASQPTVLILQWNKADKTSPHVLLRLFLSHYAWQIFAGVLPRLAFIGFTFAQPFLIDAALEFTSEPSESRRSSVGYGLVGAYFIVYLGISISFTIYNHKTYRLLTMFRGSLISMIYSQVLRAKSSEIPEAEAITLMSADIDRITQSMHLIHESYASLIELAIGLWLLYLYLGVAMAASAGFIILCLISSTPIASAAGKAQIPWLEAIESRLAVTVSAIDSLRTAKLAGFATYISRAVRELRTVEIAKSFRFRLLDALVNVSFHFCSQLGPLLGLGLYALLAQNRDGSTLDQGTAFAALSIFSLLDAPFSTLLTSLEHLQTMVSCFERIQEYLETKECNRFNIKGPSHRLRSSVTMEEMCDGGVRKEAVANNSNFLIRSTAIASLKNLSVSYSNESIPVLNNITIDIPWAETTVIIGPIGCGKSSFLRTIIYEMNIVAGSMATSFSTAAYCPQTPWIVADTIRKNIVGVSSWDTEWFQTVITACDLLKDFNEMPNGADTQVGSHGRGLSGGQQTRIALARALYSRETVLILDDVLRALDSRTEAHLLERIFAPTGLLKQFGCTAVLTTSSVHHCRHADLILVLEKDGFISKQGTPESLSSHLNLLQPELHQARIVDPDAISSERTDSTTESLDLSTQMQVLDKSRKTGDLKVYWYYFKFLGSGILVMYLLLCTIFIVGIYGSPVWIQQWTNANEYHDHQPLGYWVGVYATIAILAIIASVCSDVLVMVPRASAKFHEVLLSTTVCASAAFLDSTETGTITNRFSQDLELIDNDLPETLDTTIVHILGTIASAVLVFVGSAYVAATIPLVLLLLYCIQFYYLRASRQLRLLDIEAKAPLFSHFLETLDGVMSIRAYGWIPQYSERFLQILNTSQKPYYLLWCIQRWLGLVLNLAVTGLATLLMAVAANVHQGSTAFLGVALYNIVSFSMDLQQLVVEWTELETAIGAISRIRTYENSTEHEDYGKTLQRVGVNWPTAGEITVNHITASYPPFETPVLQELSLTIHANEKVAICGRTGSGKSSFIAALLGMLPLTSGEILIDKVDIHNVASDELRIRLNTVPQSHFMLPGDIRANIDPSGNSNDEEKIRVLKAIELWSFIKDNGELDAIASEVPFSDGQRQLFSLLRARFKPGKVLILDEINSNLDGSTDTLLQRFLWEELFPNRTVIMIVHKVETILEFDRVVVLADGRIIEMGNPRTLLNTPDSHFQSMFRG